YYQHLVLWDDQDLEVVGAYRLGECNWILSWMGKEGLYLNELCEMHDDHDRFLMEAVELGRSFVQPRYWGSRALDYLWQGIGAYLQHNPQIRYLTGPVSISAAYPKNARDAIVYFYSHYFAPKEQSLHARSPYKLSNNTNREFEEFFDDNDYKTAFTQLKNYLSAFNVNVPTLFKQYADLCDDGGVTFFDFGIDCDFNDCVDGYILVDRRLMKEAKQKRYIK
ncbi:MAG: GNAT family N-acyltransferase, partial [Sulfurimonadaceae bacterium]